MTAPGNISYSRTTKYGQEICVVVDNHIAQMFKKNRFHYSLFEGEAHLNSFNGTNIKRLDHFISPTLVEDWPDIVLIQIEPNNITDNKLNK